MSKKITTFEEYHSEYAKSIQNPEAFWEEKAEKFTWKKKWDTVLDWDFTKPEIKWFEGGKLNITENCLDRHLEERGNQTAIKWIANNPNEKNKSLSYKELHSEVCKFAKDSATKSDLNSERLGEIFLDDIIEGLFDLRALSSSFEGASSLMYLINGSMKGIDGYIKRLIDETRLILKKNELKTFDEESSENKESPKKVASAS